MMLRECESLAEAYELAVSEVHQNGSVTEAITDPFSVGSMFGRSPRTTIESTCAGFTIRNPLDRIIKSTVQPFDVRLALANTLWTISGSSSLSDIEPYNPNGSSFSPDGLTLEGAMGTRIFGGGLDSQFETAVSLLREHPTSRRAAVQVFFPSDLTNQPLDTPCVLSVQYLIRQGKLHSTTFMRSQSALKLLPYDVFLFTMIQEYLAGRLSVELGSYSHIAGSLHYYEEESEIISRFLKDQVTSPGPMPRMPSTTASEMEQVLWTEHAIRMGESPSPGGDRSVGIYWRDILGLLESLLEERRTL